ncbi:hypothetical protein B0H16DRAFT_105665 [Mycena metata]|uniref:Uncharacterized protein n=1 Tax=Mycena metata TaxID=1033252 RepID=A0AAD7IA67_9AGAR|nr:hypothetical protein B0H16DRAFT_105665 [Mycena metata]
MEPFLYTFRKLIVQTFGPRKYNKSPSPSPFLPPELERKIFEIAASAGNTTIPPLLRVAKRVKIWLEPLLYRRVLIPSRPSSGEPFLSNGDVMISITALAAAMQRLPPGFLATHVHHLYLEVWAYRNSVYDRNRMFAALAGVTDLMLLNLRNFDGVPSLLEEISRLPLRRLHVRLAELFQSAPPAIGGVVRVDFSHPLFRNITHLSVLSEFKRDWTTGLSLVPCLTHLSFPNPAFDSDSLLVELFRACKILRVLVVLLDPYYGDYPAEFHRMSQQEPRVVFVKARQILGWHSGICGLGGYWEQAETVIEERRLSASDNVAV